MCKVTIVSGIQYTIVDQTGAVARCVWRATVYVGDKPTGFAQSYDQGAAVADAVARHRMTRTIRR